MPKLSPTSPLIGPNITSCALLAKSVPGNQTDCATPRASINVGSSSQTSTDLCGTMNRYAFAPWISGCSTGSTENFIGAPSMNVRSNVKPGAEESRWPAISHCTTPASGAGTPVEWGGDWTATRTSAMIGDDMASKDTTGIRDPDRCLER